jgi:queuine/archaeosine tRNA-ribosyltransferase
VFAATAADDERLWSWRRGVRPDAVLISYDVLRLGPGRLSAPVRTTLGFGGFVIVDSGGYGTNSEQRPTAVYAAQRAVGADLGVALDRVALSTESSRLQWRAVNDTVRNAQAIRRRHRGRMALEAVIQGATPAQLEACGERLARLRFQAYGVPVSMQSKYRRYAAAVERVLHATAHLPPTAVVHALGCGSRTLIAILSAFGVTIFDSRSFYQRAIYGENIEGITMCALGTPKGKPACGACLQRTKPGRTLQGRVDHNLQETLKETIRVRCALEESALEGYLRRRLGKKLFAEIALVVERLAPLARRRTPFSRP